ncbi:protein CROWDED NUCLEI 1 [Populus alba x Populus x berolinensis]|uniref:Protein CROWDED NUCLEI 1 n=1 Tax=Populus alba x Populus x berolinensis TaxID=444605 RepID=A0AAD6LJ80_9ROSI|nr:protein CROWDED NUCLEI 1 [Populus alba x Populus x berolinensis]
MKYKRNKVRGAIPMFTPQRKVWSGWSLTPRSEAGQKNGSEPGSDLKGKSVGFVEQVTPNGVRPNLDGEDLADKVSRLENELFEYQYNMGLLLIEKKEWGSKHEELMQAFTEATEAVKREQAAHLIALSDAEKQEENLRRALGVEKQCVLDLEKAVREMRSENADIKFTADSKLAEAKALVMSIEEKSLEVEVKLRAADAKLAEVSRKSSDIQRKLLDVESRESTLRMERLSFIAEKEVYETTFSKQREDLQEWEKKLQEGEERLSKSQRIINQREERANENDRILKQKEKDLEEAQKKIEDANSILKRKEDDIKVKEVELRALEEKLNERERVEIKKLTDEHNAILDAKKHEFELEAEQKKKSLDEDLKNKKKRETEIKHKEEKAAKREQALDKKLEKCKEKENEFESKSKSLKEREKAIRSEQKKFEGEKNQLESAKENFLNLKAELEKTKASNEEQLLKIHEEKERLKVSEEERSEYARLQAELKEEINKCRLQEELLLKDADDLKQQKGNFEREWEDLDEKRAEAEKELKSIQERIRNERKETENYIKRELEALQVAKESFEAIMEHERSVMAEKAQNERNQMLHSIEMQKTELENELQRRQEEMDRLLQEKEKLFEEEREREFKNSNFLRDVARREMEDMKLERLRIEKEKQEVDEKKRHLQEQQIEMREDIDKLGNLSRKLKDHREQFIKEKERFIVFVEQNKDCKNCGELTSEFVLSDLISSQEIEKADALPTSKLVNNHVTTDDGNLAASEKHDSEISPTLAHSVSPVSWLRKCTSKILKFSAGKRIEPAALQKFD